jgi:hypothetical protein
MFTDGERSAYLERDDGVQLQKKSRYSAAKTGIAGKVSQKIDGNF